MQVGSGLHGVTVAGQDDRDEMGVCIEPPSCVIGLEPFEQYQFRTQEEGVRSGPGDLDLVIYSLRKWAKLAAQGNPTVLLLLFAPHEEWVDTGHAYWHWWGAYLQAHKDLFLSKDCGRRFMGYLQAQKLRMLGLRSRRTNRPELVEIYGYDTKFAYHAIRLGLQGIELLNTGGITLPMPEPHRSTLIDLRQGLYSKQYALDWIDDLADDLNHLMGKVDLPDQVSSAALNSWLVNMYMNWWDEAGSIKLDRIPPESEEEVNYGENYPAAA